MGIGVSVFLVAVGAVLTFAVNAVVPHLDLALVGVILMIAGVAGFLMSLMVWGPRNRAVVAQPVVTQPVAVQERTVVERPVY